MNPQLRNGLIVAGGVIFAFIAGWQIAYESFLLTGALGGVLLLWLASRTTQVPADALLGGFVLAGYLIGNRGFAQLSVPRLPLLPGELALGVGLVIALWTAAREKVLPLRRDLLNMVLLVWLAFGSGRLVFDIRVHGFVALRDFAIFYYALFFFLGQGWWSDPAKRRWIKSCLTVGFAIGPLVLLAFTRWPDFFIRYLSVAGIPVVFVKSDVQAGLLVAGTFWLLHRYIASRRVGWLLLSAASFYTVAISNSRAAVVALVVGCGWLVVARDWRALRPIGGMVLVGLLVLLISPVVSRNPWQQSLGYRFYQSALSVLDIHGTRTYTVADLADKPDNNLFRLTWWRAVVHETWSDGRWLGLGFGHDLSSQFTRTYYAESTEEFTARSPHNFPLTVFGRTGLVGTALLLVYLMGMAVRTRRMGSAARLTASPESHEVFMMWVGTWGIFVSACFGVVLEGPMGAAVFWTLLGMANAATTLGVETAEPAPEPVPHLPAPEPAAEIPAAS